jgi:hypothetical protein
MRSLLNTAVFYVFLVISAQPAIAAPETDLTGTWTFTWDNDPKNSNIATVRTKDGTFTGIYTNDSKDKCPLAGRMIPPGKVKIAIVCPKWDIVAEGAIGSANSASGSYIAYGDSKGTFTMSRK